METPTTEPNSPRMRHAIIEVVVGLVMLVLAFFAVASSDVSASATQWYWSALVALFAVVAFISDWLHTDHPTANPKSVITIALHWLAVFLAIELVHNFVHSGRFTYADTGLTNALVLALGTFLFGVHGNWRFCVIGASLAVATWVVAFVEAYLWVLFCVAVVAILCLVLGARLMHRLKA